MGKKPKTVPTEKSVEAFLDEVEPEQKRDDCRAIAKMMEEVTGEPSKMWGTGIVGFGLYHYEYASGHSGDSCLIGFAPRKSNIVLYLMGALTDAEELKKLGKVKTSKGCLYLNRLEEVNAKVLKNLMKKAVTYVKSKK